MDYYTYDKIKELEEKILSYPQGTVVTKTISGKKRMYLQWRENKMTRSKYLKESEVEKVKRAVSERQELERKLRMLLRENNKSIITFREGDSLYNTNVLTGDGLFAAVSNVKKYKKRYCFSDLMKYVNGDYNGKICILYGLRRTGKTTLIFQAINELSIDYCAYIKIKSTDNMSILSKDLNVLYKQGYKYVFIDEVTLMEDFIDTASVLSDIYSQMGMKIIVSGTDSLGFSFASRDELYDRNITIHTSFISYGEYSYLLDINSIDEYIEYGGTLKKENMSFDDPDSFFDEVSFRDDESTRKYIDTSISRNIQHSIKNNRFLGYLHHLKDLYEAGELTNVINRIIENMNHDFLASVINERFKSHNLASAKELLLYDGLTESSHVLYDINNEEVLNNLKNILDIKEKEETTVKITIEHLKQVKTYLYLLDLIVNVPTIYDDLKEEDRIIFVQPGMRYAITKALVYSLLKDKYFCKITEKNKKYIIDKILDDVKGRMLEDIVLLEVNKKLKKTKKAFKFKFISGGEIDMIIYDEAKASCEIYEIKHSSKTVFEQGRYLRDKSINEEIERRFGTITKRVILYRGNDTIVEGVEYKNVEEYLKVI